VLAEVMETTMVKMRMKRVALCVLAILPTVAAQAQVSVQSRTWKEEKVQAAPTLLVPVTAPARTLTLGTPTASERMQKSAAAAPAPASKRPVQVGFNRTLVAGQRFVASTQLPWQTGTDGSQVAHLVIRSLSAKAVRVQLSVAGSGGGQLKFASPSDAREVYGPFNADGSVWSPVIDGDALVVELWLPPGRDRTAVSISLDTVAHLDAAGGRGRDANAPSALNIGTSSICEVDIACTSNASPALLSVKRSVAKMVFTTSDGSFLCTGTLLSSTDPSLPPYFYTANHCINTQAAAASLTTFWDFEAATCGGNTAPNYVQKGGGAVLLYNDKASDVSLVKLNQRPPSDAVYAAWNSATLVPSVNVVGIHHPSGDLKKFGRGRTYGYGDFDGDTGAVINGSDNKVLMTWSGIGETEGGSSGSGLFTLSADGSQYELRGGLFGGSSGLQCAGPVQDSYYSRFDRAFASLKQYLAP
jgi:hypothetical protein